MLSFRFILFMYYRMGGPVLTFRHLEIFYAIAQTGSFRRAAERLFITQSAVSHAVRELEA